jgi:hypothetical protein
MAGVRYGLETHFAAGHPEPEDLPAGWARAAPGAPRRTFVGFVRISNTERARNTEHVSHAERVKRRRAKARRLREDGASVRAVARKLGVSTSTAHADLRAEDDPPRAIANLQRQRIDGSLEPVAGAEPGNRRAQKGGWTSVRVLAPRAEELRNEITELVPVHGPADEPAVRLLSWQLARIERANAWLDEHGLLDAEGSPQPVLKVLSTWENSAARLMDQLGLSPTSRAWLGVDLSRGAVLAEERLRSVEGAGARAVKRIEAEP